MMLAVNPEDENPAADRSALSVSGGTGGSAENAAKRGHLTASTVYYRGVRAIAAIRDKRCA